MDQEVTDLIQGKPLRGWLRKHGGVVRGWQRRFFVLKTECLFCFLREDDTRISHTYLLDEYTLNELPTSNDDPDKFPFELVSEKQPSESVMLCAATEEERKSWVKALCYSIYAHKGGAIFGLPLEETMKFEHRLGRKIPYIVEACIHHLEKYAMDTEGIFRLAGRAGLLKDLRAQFETGQRPSLDKVDVHTVASLLKAYLRELPESLIPPGMYQRAMNFAMRYSEHKVEADQLGEVTGLAQLLGELSDDSYNTLSYICQFLHRLAGNTSKTKMDARNLALIFGPNLIRHLDNNPELMMVTADLTQHLAYMMIHHYSIVLAPRSEPSSHASAFVVPRPHGGAKVPIADLLRLSKPVDLNDESLLRPQLNNFGDLEGLVFPYYSDKVCKSSGDLSPSSPVLSPLLLVEDHFKSLDEQGCTHEVPMQGDIETGIVDAGAFEEMLEFARRPVAPRRTKSRMNRQRRSCGTPTSPVSGEWSSERRQLDTEDVKAALSSRSQSPFSETSSECSAESPVAGRPDSSQNADSSALKLRASQEPPQVAKTIADDVQVRSGRDNGAMTDKQKSRFDGVVNGEVVGGRPERLLLTDDGKVGPSRACLESQVAGLKLELVNTKARSDHLISMMKAQLMDMREKYENRIRTMENQHRSQVTDLATKLEMERAACADAVQRTVTLQNQLYKYKLLYGELKD